MSTMKIHPSVEAVINPIINDITRINLIERTNPAIGPHNEPQAHKEIKRACVHIMRENNGNGVRICLTKGQDGKMYCEGCGRVVNTRFDQTSIDKLNDALEVLNQVCVFGIVNGLRAEPLQKIITCKTLLPGIMTILAELNEFVKRDDAANDSERNIGLEYQTPGNMRGITKM